MHGRGKDHTPHLVVPFKEKHSSDGEVTRKKARVTAADLVSNKRIASTFVDSLAGGTLRQAPAPDSASNCCCGTTTSSGAAETKATARCL